MAAGDFEAVMQPGRYKAFTEFLDTLKGDRLEKGSTDFIIQLLVSETKHELANPLAIPWLATVYQMVYDQTYEALEYSGCFPAEDHRDISELEHMADIGCFSLAWSEVAWDRLDWQTDAHETAIE